MAEMLEHDDLMFETILIRSRLDLIGQSKLAKSIAAFDPDIIHLHISPI